MNEENLVGQTIEILINSPNSAWHPTENRYLAKGDIITISEQKYMSNNKWLYAYDVNPKFGKENSTFGSNKQSITRKNFKIYSIWHGLIDLESLIK